MTTLAVIGPVVIHAGEAVSDAIDCSGSIRIARIILPDDWTGGAPLTFQLSPDGTSYHDLYHLVTPGSAYISYEVTVPNPPPGASITMPLDYGQDVSWLKIRSGTALLPVMQEADRAFTLV